MILEHKYTKLVISNSDRDSDDKHCEIIISLLFGWYLIYIFLQDFEIKSFDCIIAHITCDWIIFLLYYKGPPKLEGNSEVVGARNDGRVKLDLNIAE